MEEEREKEGQDQTSATAIRDGVCAICLDSIQLQETALVKGCEHAYWFVLLFSFFLFIMLIDGLIGVNVSYL